MAVFRKIWEIRALDLTAAEEELLRACSEGQEAEIGDEVPGAGETEKSIRAGIIRYLMLGGCAGYRPHEKGVRICGATICGILDLENCASTYDLWLENCSLTDPLVLQDAKLRKLGLRGSICLDIHADRLNSKGGIFLDNKFVSKGIVSFSGIKVHGNFNLQGTFCSKSHNISVCIDNSHIDGNVFMRNSNFLKGQIRLKHCLIDGNLEFDSSSVRNSKGRSINAEGASIQGSVFLRKGFKSLGEVCLMSAYVKGSIENDNGVFINKNGKCTNFENSEIDGSIFCRNSSTLGELRIAGASVQGSIELDGSALKNKNNRCLNISNSTVNGSIFLRKGMRTIGFIDLCRANVGSLNDDEKSWPTERGAMLINGFEYTTISGGPTDAKSRLRWLSLCNSQIASEDFWPQPYEQLAKVLREMGHANDARTVLVEKERLQRADFRRRLIAEARASRWRRPIAYVGAGLSWFWQQLLDGAVGFGYRPQYALYILIALIFAGGLLFQKTWNAGDFAPNSALVLNSPGWADVQGDANPAEAWSDPDGAGKDYESFSAGAYAFDVVVPLIDIGQETAWAPSTKKGVQSWGYHAWWLRWVLKILGWIVSALGAAAITGIIRRE